MGQGGCIGEAETRGAELSTLQGVVVAALSKPSSARHGRRQPTLKVGIARQGLAAVGSDVEVGDHCRGLVGEPGRMAGYECCAVAARSAAVGTAGLHRQVRQSRWEERGRHDERCNRASRLTVVGVDFGAAIHNLCGGGVHHACGRWDSGASGVASSGKAVPLGVKSPRGRPQPTSDVESPEGLACVLHSDRKAQTPGACHETVADLLVACRVATAPMHAPFNP